MTLFLTTNLNNFLNFEVSPQQTQYNEKKKKSGLIFLFSWALCGILLIFFNLSCLSCYTLTKKFLIVSFPLLLTFFFFLLYYYCSFGFTCNQHSLCYIPRHCLHSGINSLTVQKLKFLQSENKKEISLWSGTRYILHVLFVNFYF